MRHKNNTGNNVDNNSNCTRRGWRHTFKYPAFEIQYNNCKRFNDFAKFCKSKAVKTILTDGENEPLLDYFFVGTVNTINNKNYNQIRQINLSINNVIINCQLDICVQINIMSVKI